MVDEGSRCRTPFLRSRNYDMFLFNTTSEGSKTMIRRVQFFVSAVTLFVCLCTQVSFGAVTGRISGTVKDPTGAVIPNAEVTALETQTGIRTMTKTDAAGFYSFPSLP